MWADVKQALTSEFTGAARLHRAASGGMMGSAPDGAQSLAPVIDANLTLALCLTGEVPQSD